MRSPGLPDLRDRQAAGIRLPRKAPEARRGDIVREASQLFLKDGFAATSMSTIARAVGGSKATLYRYFPTKEALFEAVMEERSAAVIRPVHEASLHQDTPQAYLVAVGETLMRGVFQTEALAINRVVIGDCVRSPEISHVFLSLGPDRSRAIVAEQLVRFNKAGLLSLTDPATAAEDFFALLRGEVWFRVIVGAVAAPQQSEISAHVRRIVDVLLRSWASD